MNKDKLNLLDFYKLGQEQWIVQPSLPRKLFIYFFGPLGVNSRIRSAHILNQILSSHLLREKAKVLDVGFGHGYALFYLSQRFPQCHFTGIDINKEMVENGQVIASRKRIKNLSFIHGDIQSIELNEKFDVILSADVLEHIHDDLGTVRKLRFMLSDGGNLILHLPKKYSQAWRFLPSFKTYKTPDHVREEYTYEEINRLLQQGGFNIKSIKFSYSKWGELAFETNYLFFSKGYLRIIFALFFHPISILLGYLDTVTNYPDGNSFIITAS